MSKKITELNSAGAPNDGMLFEVVDPLESNVNNRNKKITWQQLKSNLEDTGTNDSFTAYDNDFTYVGGETYFVSFDNNIWQFIADVDQTGVEPGTNASVWNLTSAGQFAHEKNKDTFLDFGGTNQVGASEVQKKSIEVTGNITAVNDAIYTNTATATYTDPTPAQGKGFTVFVRNGTATVGGTAYATAGTLIKRIYHSGAWANYAYNTGGGGSSFDPTVDDIGNITPTNTAIADNDTVNVAFGKTQGQLDEKLNLSGGTLTGNISLGGNNLNMVGGNINVSGGNLTLGDGNISGVANLTSNDLTINGTGGNGFVSLNNQSSNPSAVNGTIRLFANSSAQLTWVRRNNANSATIRRTFIAPDQNVDYTLPTPASGTASTLAGLNTAQEFTQQQTFTGTHRIQTLQIRDFGGTYPTNTISSTSASNITIQVPSGGILNLTANTVVASNIMQATTLITTRGIAAISATGGPDIGSAANASSNIRIGGVFSGTNYLNEYSQAGSTTNGLILETASQAAATGSWASLIIRSAGQTNASNTNVGAHNRGSILMYTRDMANGLESGSIYIDTCLTTAGADGTGVKGGVVFFNRANASINWQGLQRGIFVGNRTSAPTGNPTAGYFMYADSGNPVYRTSGGAIITLTRTTGWGLPTGTLTRTTFDTATVTTTQLAERVAALINDLRQVNGFLSA